MKILYTYKVGKPTIVETSSKNEEGEEVVTKNKSYVDEEVFIKKPSHREIDEMDLFYSIQISDLQSKGVATNTMILNSYQDSGGLDSKKEVEGMKKLLKELNFKRNQLIKNSAEKIIDDALLEEVKNLTIELQDYQNRLSSVFDRSAESIAERRVILWAVLNLLFTKTDGGYKPLISGKNHEERLDNYYNILDEDTGEFEKKAIERGQIFLSSWLKKQVENEEDFKTLDSIIQEAEGDEES